MISLAPSSGILKRYPAHWTFPVRFLTLKLRDLEHKVRDLAHKLEILCLHNMKPAKHGPGLHAVDRGTPLKLLNRKKMTVIRGNFYRTVTGFAAGFDPCASGAADAQEAFE